MLCAPCFRRKLSWTKDEALREKAKRVFITECDKVKPATPEAKTKDGDDDFFVFESIEETSEVTSYLKDPPASLASLEGFPSVKSTFLKFNSTLPSSAAVERLFSCAG